MHTYIYIRPMYKFVILNIQTNKIMFLVFFQNVRHVLINFIN